MRMSTQKQFVCPFVLKNCSSVCINSSCCDTQRLILSEEYGQLGKQENLIYKRSNGLHNHSENWVQIDDLLNKKYQNTKFITSSLNRLKDIPSILSQIQSSFLAHQTTHFDFKDKEFVNFYLGEAQRISDYFIRFDEHYFQNKLHDILLLYDKDSMSYKQFGERVNQAINEFQILENHVYLPVLARFIKGIKESPFSNIFESIRTFANQLITLHMELFSKLIMSHALRIEQVTYISQHSLNYLQILIRIFKSQNELFHANEPKTTPRESKMMKKLNESIRFQLSKYGEFFLTQCDIQNAIQCYNDCLELNFESFDTFLSLIKVYRKLRDKNGLKQTYLLALLAFPQKSLFLVGLLELLNITGPLQASIVKEYLASLALPSSPGEYIALGKIFEKCDTSSFKIFTEYVSNQNPLAYFHQLREEFLCHSYLLQNLNPLFQAKKLNLKGDEDQLDNLKNKEQNSRSEDYKIGRNLELSFPHTFENNSINSYSNSQENPNNLNALLNSQENIHQNIFENIQYHPKNTHLYNNKISTQIPSFTQNKNIFQPNQQKINISSHIQGYNIMGSGTSQLQNSTPQKSHAEREQLGKSNIEEDGQQGFKTIKISFKKQTDKFSNELDVKAIDKSSPKELSTQESQSQMCIEQSSSDQLFTKKGDAQGGFQKPLPDSMKQHLEKTKKIQKIEEETIFNSKKQTITRSENYTNSQLSVNQFLEIESEEEQQNVSTIRTRSLNGKIKRNINLREQQEKSDPIKSKPIDVICSSQKEMQNMQHSKEDSVKGKNESLKEFNERLIAISSSSQSSDEDLSGLAEFWSLVSKLPKATSGKIRREFKIIGTCGQVKKMIKSEQFTFAGGVYIYYLNRFDKAKSLLEESLVLNKDNLIAMKLLGGLYMTMDNIQSALPLFKQLNKDKNNSWFSHLSLGFAMQHKLNDTTRAIMHYKKSIELNPSESAFAYLQLAKIYKLSEITYSLAIQSYEQGLKQNQKMRHDLPSLSENFMCECFLELGVLLIREKRFQQAEIVLKFMSTSEKQLNARVLHSLLGEVYSKMNKPQLALRSFQEASKYVVNSTSTSGNIPAALIAFKIALIYDLEFKDYKTAKKEYLFCLEKSQQEPLLRARVLYRLLLIAYDKLPDYAEMNRYYLILNQIHPDYRDTNFLIASGMFAQTMHVQSQIQQGQQQNHHIQQQKMHVNKQRVDNIMSLLTRCVEKEIRKVESLHLIAKCNLQLLENIPQAIQYLKLVINADPSYAPSFLTIADIYLMNDKTHADTLLAMTKKLKPELPYANYLQAKLAQNLNKYPQAVQIYRNILKLHSEIPNYFKKALLTDLSFCLFQTQNLKESTFFHQQAQLIEV